jgi:hypothetical protein
VALLRIPVVKPLPCRERKSVPSRCDVLSAESRDRCTSCANSLSAFLSSVERGDASERRAASSSSSCSTSVERRSINRWTVPTGRRAKPPQRSILNKRLRRPAMRTSRRIVSVAVSAISAYPCVAKGREPAGWPGAPKPAETDWLAATAPSLRAYSGSVAYPPATKPRP